MHMCLCLRRITATAVGRTREYYYVAMYCVGRMSVQVWLGMAYTFYAQLAIFGHIIQKKIPGLSNNLQQIIHVHHRRRTYCSLQLKRTLALFR